MSLWKIAWRSIQQRGLASVLTALSMALGVMLVVAVLSIYGVVAESFRNNANLGYNLIVGPKGGKLQLTLNTVYYLSEPVETLPYSFYLEFLPADKRDRELRNSLQYQGHAALWNALETQSLAGGSSLGMGLAGLVPIDTLQEVTARQIGFVAIDTNPLVPLELGRPGKYAQFTDFAIPVTLGDYFHQFRAVGTTPAMLDRVYDLERERKFEFAEGRNFEHYNSENGFFEAVVGWRVAQQTGVRIGDQIAPTHADPEGEGHEQTFRVVGILAPSGTPNDRAVFINVEGFYLMSDHAKPLEEGEQADRTSARKAIGTGSAESVQLSEPLMVEQREVSAMLVRTIDPIVAIGLENSLNEGLIGQAVLPNREIFTLLEMIVRPIQLSLLALTVMICVVSGISILVSIYNSMSDRRHEIAVMRALGANRETVSAVVLMEAILLSLGGGVLGWLAGHGVNWLASPLIEDRTGVRIGFWTLSPAVDVLDVLRLDSTIELSVSSEFLLIPALVLLAVLVGFLPALAAYRTDVAEALGK